MGPKNTHIEQTCINILLIFNQQKQVTIYNLVFWQRGIEWPRFRPRFFTDNFRSGKFKQNWEKSFNFRRKNPTKFVQKN